MSGTAILIAIMLSPPLYVLENANLTVRMISDMLLFAYAIIFGYSLQKYVSSKMISQNMKGLGIRAFNLLNKFNLSSRGFIFVVLVPAALLVYWNFPSTFDLTANNLTLRYVSDLSYLVAAVLAGLALTQVPKKFKIIILYFTFMCVGMMGSMMLVWSPGFYTVYSPSQNTDMNTFMMLFGAFGIMGSSSYLLRVMDVI